MKIFIAAAMVCLLACNAFSQSDGSITLDEVDTTGGRPLMQVLKERSSSRAFSEKELPKQILSELLWAAFGINRPDSGKRTAPSAHDFQEIDIYVSMKSGLYLYEPKQHILTLVLEEDLRSLTGLQEFSAVAPVNLIYVADYSKMGEDGDENELYSAMDAGFISQNVYLYCASAGLGTVVKGWIDKPALSKAMKLSSEQRIVLSQTVGYKI